MWPKCTPNTPKDTISILDSACALINPLAQINIKAEACGLVARWSFHDQRFVKFIDATAL